MIVNKKETVRRAQRVVAAKRPLIGEIVQIVDDRGLIPREVDVLRLWDRERELGCIWSITAGLLKHVTLRTLTEQSRI